MRKYINWGVWMFNSINKIKKPLFRAGLLFLCVFSLMSASVLDTYASPNSDNSFAEKSVKSSSLTAGYSANITPQNSSAHSAVQVPKGDIYKNKDVYNFLLLGTDERDSQLNDNARADAILILSVNKKKHTIRLVSLERGIAVPIPGKDDDWLTHTFRYGGADLTLQTVRECLKVDVNRYIRVNFSIFEEIINLVGGVDITLTQAEVKALNNEVYTNAVTQQKVTVGLNHLDGYDALQYCRLRFIDSDWSRIQRQRTTIQAVINQARHLDIKEMTVLIYKVFSQIQTNIKADEIASWLFELPSFLGVEATQMTIPVKGTYYGKTASEGRSLIMVDFEENAKVLNEFLSE